MLVYHEHNALWSGQFIGGRKTQGKSHCGSPDALKAKPEVLHLTPVTSKRRPWAVAQIRCILVIDLPVVWNYIFILFVCPMVKNNYGLAAKQDRDKTPVWGRASSSSRLTMAGDGECPY